MGRGGEKGKDEAGRGKGRSRRHIPRVGGGGGYPMFLCGPSERLLSGERMSYSLQRLLARVSWEPK